MGLGFFHILVHNIWFGMTEEKIVLLFQNLAHLATEGEEMYVLIIKCILRIVQLLSDALQHWMPVQGSGMFCVLEHEYLISAM